MVRLGWVPLLGPISPTFYEQILRAQMSKAQKHIFDCLFALFWIFAGTAPHKMLMKFTSGLNFINVLCTAFTRADPKSA
jgi:hypothetical protein